MKAPGMQPAGTRASLIGSALKTAYALPPAAPAFDDLLAALDGAGLGGDKHANAPRTEAERQRRRWFGHP